MNFFNDTKTREDRIGDIAKPLTPACPHGICDGSGVIGTMAYDSDSHQYVPDGEKACLCALDERTDEDDNSADL